MQPTPLGSNMTGASLSPAALQAMNEAADALTPDDLIETAELDAHKLRFAEESEPVGSIPAPTSVKGVAKAGMALVKGGHPAVLTDKVGERIAFERSGTRLYDALILKHRAALAAGLDDLPAARWDDGASEAAPAETLARIRAEEHAHFQLLCDAMRTLGGDPTAVTPCADVAAVASAGIMQVLTDPRTTLAQCLNAMLTAELTDNAGWELLIQLAEDAGETDLVAQFMLALAEEQQHLEIVKTWLTAIVVNDPQPSLL